MSESGSSSTTSLPLGPPLALLLAIGAAILNSSAPLQSSRPEVESIPPLEVHAYGNRRARARLWQDPLKAVNEEIARQKKVIRERDEREYGVEERNRQMEFMRDLVDRTGAAVVQMAELKESWEANKPPGPPPPTESGFTMRIQRGPARSSPSPADAENQVGNTRVANRVPEAPTTLVLGRIADSTSHDLPAPISHIPGPKAKESSVAAANRVDTDSVYLLVALPGSPYPEDSETRLRTRYAVISALGQLGFEPEQTEHIDWLPVPKSCWELKKELDGYASPLDAANKLQLKALRAPSGSHLFIPFEKFNRTRVSDRSAGRWATPYAKIAVFWIDEDKLREWHRDKTAITVRTAVDEPVPECEFCPGHSRYESRVPAYERLRHLLDAHPRAGWVDKKRDQLASLGISDRAQKYIASAGRQAVKYIREDMAPNVSEPLAAFLQTEVAPSLDRFVSPPKFILIGPSNSDDITLLTDGTSKLPFEVYSPWATKPGLTELMKDTAHRYTPTVCDDSALFKALLAELEKWRASPNKKDSQWLDDGKYMAIVSEWDTKYGRNWQAMVEERFPPSPNEEHPQVRVVRYLRGLDGLTPGYDADEKPDDPDQKERSNNPRADFPAGRKQLDYARRIASDLQDWDRTLRNKGKGHLAAIGIVGTDVYDKLLLLRALRPAFSGAVFFTTDLDARFLHPTEYPFTRNMLIASSYGLRLADRWQGNAPPFRDSHQTAVFLTATYALIDQSNPAELDGKPATGAVVAARDENARVSNAFWQPEPLIYETGRTRFCGLNRLEEPSIHPESSWKLGVLRWKNGKLLLLFGMIWLIALFAPMFVKPLLLSERAWQISYTKPEPLPLRELFYDWKQSLVESIRDWKQNWPALWTASRTVLRRFSWWLLCTLILPAILFLALYVIYLRLSAYCENGKGEPVSFIEGISSWPTDLLRITGIFIGGCLLYHMKSVTAPASARYPSIWKRLVHRWRARARLYRMGDALRHRKPAHTCDAKISPRLLRKPTIVRWREKTEPWTVPDFLAAYRHWGKWKWRVKRSLGPTLAFFIIGFVVLYLAKWPYYPIRSNAVLLFHQVILVVYLSVTLLTFFLALDAALLADSFIRLVSPESVTWHKAPASTNRANDGEHQGHTVLCEERLRTMRLIAEMTAKVGRCIPFPFVLLLVFVVSRNRIFDNWDWPASLIVLMVVLSGGVLYCAFVLGKSAHQARRVALMHLQEERSLLAAQMASPAKQSQLANNQNAIDEITAIRTGSFSPLLQHPILNAVLIPFGGIGLFEILLALAKGDFSTGFLTGSF